MNLPPVTYLTVDSVGEGVGASQIVPYVERLAARGVHITLHSFERVKPSESVTRRLAAAGVRWHPHSFGSGGAAGGLARVAHGAALVARAELVHARSDLPAASALLSRRPAWVWDMRSFWREQRISLGLVREGSAEERVMRAVEAAAARRSTGIITLSQAAITVLQQRHGDDIGSKARIITTCVDLGRFRPTPFPPTERLALLLSGTFNRLYDVPTMVRLTERIRARRPADLTVLTQDQGQWDPWFRKVEADVRSAQPSEMPVHVSQHHIGLSLLSPVAGVSSHGAMPTKIGEFLACGRPVVVSPALGDLDRLLSNHRCGVVVRSRSDEGLDRATEELDALVADPGTPGRCRALAEAHFDLDRGVDQLLDIYHAAAR